MTLTVQTATVLGAGTMGAAIAGVLADAGIQVHLLDLASEPETEPASGRGREPAGLRGRSRLAWAGLERMRTLRPSNLYDEQSVHLIRPGNLEDDFETALAQSDWILEAVVEDLAAKQELLARVATSCPPGAFVSSNTSGLPIHLLCRDLDADFSRRFFGTHFFNPPRYLPLLELIPHQGTDAGLLAAFRVFAAKRLGRETVECRDIPYFIGNRIFAFVHQVTLNTALDLGLTVHETDQLTGPLTGRPRAATFRLCDIIGLDVMQLVCTHLHALLPEDPYRDVYRHPGSGRVMDLLQASGHLGNKTGQGFYQVRQRDDGGKAFWGLDLAAAQQGQLAYLPPATLQDEGLARIQNLPLPERFRALLAQESIYGTFLWEVFGRTFEYLSHIADQIAADIYAIDRALRWGFHWQMGPFELWDALGLAGSLERMRASGFTPGPWVQDLARTPGSPDNPAAFHRADPAPRTAHAFAGPRITVPADTSCHIYQDTMRLSDCLRANGSATLRRGRDQILYLDLHSHLNTLDPDVFVLCQEAVNHLHGSAHGLIITNNDDIFSAGANLRLVLDLVAQQDWQGLETGIRQGQDTLMALRLAPKPVIVALRGMAAGGGVELILAADRVVPHRDVGLGLVETGVGLIPGWGGCKEMVRRSVTAHPQGPPPNPLLALTALMKQIGRAQVSRHAAEARAMGYLHVDTPILARASQLLPWAEQEIHRLHDLGYCPPRATANVYAAGKDCKADLEMGNYLMQEGAYLSAHDRLLASTLTHVLCGGDLDMPAWMDEQYFLDLEREAVLGLLGEPKTRERIQHMLAEGKPLRN